MAQKKVEAHSVVRKKQVRWRVIIPADLNGGKVGAARYFKLKTDATAYARDLESQRGGNTTEFLNLPQVTQAAVIRALNRLNGDAGRIEEAVDFFLRMRPATSSGKLVPDVVTECVAQKEASGKRARYVVALSSTLARFADAHSAIAIENVTPRHVEDWLLSKNWSLRTRRGYLIDLRTLFSFALKRGYVTSNPAEAVEKPTPPQATPGILTVPQCAKLLSTAQDMDAGLVPYLAISLFAGMRKSELAKMEWSWIKEDRIDVPAHIEKNSKRRLVPIVAALADWLRFEGDLPVKNLAKRLKRVRKAAGVSWPHNCLRHSFCSYGVPVYGSAWTARAAGHEEAVLKLHYDAIADPNEAKKFWEIMPPSGDHPTKDLGEVPSVSET
jgi:site-specific recombinase XerD